MPITAAELEAIRQRLLAGVEQVRFSDREVRYGDVAGQIKLFEYMKALEAQELAAAGQGRQYVSYATFSRR